MIRASRLRLCASRLGRSALAASLGGVFAGLMDAFYAGRGLGGATLADRLAAIGLIAPTAIALGLFAGVAALTVDPDEAPSPRTLLASLRRRAVGRAADVAAFAPLIVIAAFFWMTLCAQLARVLLGLDAAPSVVGGAIAAGTVVLGILLATLVFTLLPPLRRALATACEGRRAFVDPVATSAVAILVVVGLFGYGVATGGVSGEGGLFGIWGIFKRPELDLRGAALTLLPLLGGFFGPAILSRPRSTISFAIALLPMVLTARTATSLNAQPETTERVERGAPLGRVLLPIARRLSDTDGDGVSGLFGGGDCDDGDPNISPFMREVPGNGVDEDCSGSDLTLAPLPSAAPSVEPSAARAKPTIPDDLDIVLITIDTLRADLGFMGYSRDVSPNLDKLAKRATVFERGYSLASYTGKSIGPMLIGKYGSETHRNWGHFNTFTTDDTFVAERLKQSGYATMSVQGHRYFGKFGGIERGFDAVDLSAAPPESAKWDVANDSTSEQLSDAAVAYIEDPARPKGKSFLWVHYLDPHADYLQHKDMPGFGAKSGRDLYDGEIAFTDKHIGRVLDAIARSPRADKTAIIITSDHGEAFGEHKMYRHGFELWEELVRVPLVVYVPGAKPSRVTARRSAIDLVPTILDLAKIPLPDGKDPNDFLSGTSLIADVFLDGAEPAERDIVIDMPAGPYNEARRSLIHGDMKLTVSGNVRFELYDLKADPEERKNLWKTPARADIEPIYDATKARLREIVVTGKMK